MEGLRNKLPTLDSWLAVPMLLALLAGIADVQADREDSLSGPAGRDASAVSNAMGEPGRAASGPVPNAIAPADIPDIHAAFDLPPREAVAWFRAKNVVDAKTYKLMDAASRARSFSLAELQNEYAIQVIKDKLDRAIEEGTTVNEWLNDLDETLLDAGIGAAPAAGEISHLRLVYRQNVFGALSAGRFAQMKRVAVERPWWMYRTTGDGKVRPSHAALDGKVFHHDDPFWSRFYPPWEFNCRCTVVTLDDEELTEEGIEPSSGDDPAVAGLPAGGFAGDPAERFFLNAGLAGMGETPEGRAAYEAITAN